MTAATIAATASGPTHQPVAIARDRDGDDASQWRRGVWLTAGV